MKTSLRSSKGLVGIVAGLVTAVCLSVSLSAHNLASTFTTLEWNPSDNSLEVIVEGHSHEMEVLLSLEVGERVSFLNDVDFPRLAEAAKTVLLRDVVVSADGSEPLDFKWVGLDMEGQTVYAMMEVDLAKAPDTLKVSNVMFLDLVPGQLNRIMAVRGKDRRGDDITARKPVVSLDFTRPQPAVTPQSR